MVGVVLGVMVGAEADGHQGHEVLTGDDHRGAYRGGWMPNVTWGCVDLPCGLVAVVGVMIGMSETQSSALDIAAVLAAVSRAPSVHATQPWQLEPHTDGVDLFERFEVELPYHDPRGRDRAISCGAALTNLAVTIRTQGWTTQIELFPDKERPELVARVIPSGAEQPSGADLARHAAIYRRHSYRAPFSLLGLSWRDRDALISAIGGNGVTAHVAQRKELFRLADLIDYAELVLRDDRAYQRELTSCLPGFPQPIRARSTLPWGGLVRPDTSVPDRYVMADRLGRECLVFVLTDTDSRRSHVQAGMALQRAWLTAVARGLVASVITQPWHLPAVRTSLTRLLDGNGFPQAMLRIGRPTITRNRHDQRIQPTRMRLPGKSHDSRGWTSMGA